MLGHRGQGKCATGGADGQRLAGGAREPGLFCRASGEPGKGLMEERFGQSFSSMDDGFEGERIRERK